MTGAEASLYSEEVESCLLGLLLLYPETWGHVVGEVRAYDFGSQLNCRVFEEIEKEYQLGQTPTPATISSTLSADKEFQPMVGARIYVANLVAAVVSRQGANDYAKHIRDLSARRELIALLRETEGRTFARDEPLPVVIASAVSAASKIDNGEVGSFNQGDVLQEVLRELENPRKCDSTGIEVLDRGMQGGLYRGWTYGIAAHEKAGKTTLSTTISYNLNMAGVKHTYIALEMGHIQISQRHLARYAGVNSLAFLDPKTRGSPGFIRRMAEASAEIPRNVQYLNLYHSDFDSLKAKLAREVLREGIAGFIVDYWQLVGGPQKGQSEEAHLRQVSQWIASFCREHGVWSIINAQLNSNETTFGGSGLTKSCDQLYKLYRSEISGCDKHAWLEMAVSRYTPKIELGNESIPTLFMQTRSGPYFTDFYNQDTGEIG